MIWLVIGFAALWVATLAAWREDRRRTRSAVQLGGGVLTRKLDEDDDDLEPW